MVGDLQQVFSEESGHQGHVIRAILDETHNVDGAFISFDKNNMSFQFIDHSVMELPIRETTDIEVHSKYKYYGNRSWREGNCPVTGIIESTDKPYVIEGYTFPKLIKLSETAKSGDSGAIVLSQDDHAIGIVIARFEGEDKVDGFGLAIPIQYILKNLEVDFVLL